MIRPAKFGDIPQLYALLEEMHGLTIYSHLRLDEKRAKSLLVSSIQRHGGDAAGSTNVLVSDLDGNLAGLIIGVLVPIYEIAVELLATDLMFYVRPGTPAHEGIEMLDETQAWAQRSPMVRILRFGAVDTMGDYKRVGKLYERRGFRQSGAIYEREVKAPTRASLGAGEAICPVF
jgi:hypothetical protein